VAGLPTVIAAIQGFLQRLLRLLLFFSHCRAPMIFSLTDVLNCCERSSRRQGGIIWVGLWPGEDQTQWEPDRGVQCAASSL
jgi:hypothetical protein